jgi:hypothetical protein
MNDLINDIEKLQKVTDKISKNIAWDLNVVSVLYELRNMIAEKQKIVKDFEKENMPFAEYSEYMKGVGFDA